MVEGGHDSLVETLRLVVGGRLDALRIKSLICVSFNLQIF